MTPNLFDPRLLIYSHTKKQLEFFFEKIMGKPLFIKDFSKVKNSLVLKNLCVNGN